MLLLGTVVAGYYQANASLYRFAAAEVVRASAREKAISWVLAGGILGGVFGPNLAAATRDLLPQPFTGAYLSLICVAMVALVLVSFIDFPPMPTGGTGGGWAAIARDRAPAGVHHRCGRRRAGLRRDEPADGGDADRHGAVLAPLSATPRWCWNGMCWACSCRASSPVNLIKRFGALSIMAIGLLLNLACVAFALSGTDLMHFVGALFVLGVGWNFLYIGGTTLLSEAYRPEERTTAQGAMDFWVYSTMTVTSFSSGALVTTGGWTSMNLGTLLPLSLLARRPAWLASHRRAAQNRPSTTGG